MTDVFTAEKRSAVMRAIRSEDTKPEMLVRSIVFRAGYRYRLHSKKLPGRPDLVLAKHHAAIFVNGCFWHQHAGCKRATMPATRQDYWLPKLKRNKARDQAAIESLLAKGWRVCIVWECACRKNLADQLRNRLIAFIDGSASFAEIGSEPDPQPKLAL